MRTQRLALAAVLVLVVAGAAKTYDDSAEEQDLYKAPPSLEDEIRGLKVREIKYRLRKRHGVSPDKAVLDKSELVKLLVDAERAAVAQNLHDASASRRQDAQQADAARGFALKVAAAVLGLVAMVAVFVPGAAASVASAVRGWGTGYATQARAWAGARCELAWAAATCGPLALVALPLAAGGAAVDLFARAVSWSLLWRMACRALWPAALGGPGGGAPAHWPEAARAAAAAHVHCLRALPSLPLGSWDLGPMAALWGVRYAQKQVDALVLHLVALGGGAPPPPFPPPPPQAQARAQAQEEPQDAAFDLQAMFAEAVRRQQAANDARAAELAAQAEPPAPQTGFVPDYDFVVGAANEDSDEDEEEEEEDESDDGDPAASGHISDLD